MGIDVNAYVDGPIFAILSNHGEGCDCNIWRIFAIMPSDNMVMATMICLGEADGRDEMISKTGAFLADIEAAKTALREGSDLITSIDELIKTL